MLRVSLPSRLFAKTFALRLSMGAAVLFATTAGSLRAEELPTTEAAVQEAQQLRAEARQAAEQGDFVTAVKQIEDAARLSGDRRTADQARQISQSLQPAAGGSPFANPQELMQLIMNQTGDPPEESWIDLGGQLGTITPFTSGQGVFVGAQAVMASLAVRNDVARLETALELARTANHNVNVRQQAALRMVSLPRLEQRVRELTAAGQPVPEEIANLAGLTRIEYVFAFPETGDVVIAGPAGDWIYDGRGQAVSAANSRPTLQLDDLITLTRTFSAEGAGFFMCTIDPKQDQVQQLQDFVRRNRRGLTPATVGQWTAELEQQLGLQNVFVQGVPFDSRVAAVIVEADYRMKEIGIGKRNGAPGMKSYFDLLTRSERRGSSMNALRWWMTVGYEAINVSPTGNVFQLTGQSVQCLSEDQLVNADGSRQATGKARRPNAEFARLFTEHLPVLAEQDPVFADLQNIFDVALVSALLHSHGLAQRVGWSADGFSVAGGYDTESVDVPTELMTAAAHRVYDDRNIVIQVAGGVRADVAAVVADEKRFRNVDELTAEANNATPVGQQNNRWWWDAATR